MSTVSTRMVLCGLIGALTLQIPARAPAASVSGSSTFRPLTGVALDSENRAAIATARVVLLEHGRIVDEAVTDKDGQFQFDAVANGDYVLQLALFSDQGDSYGYPQLTEWSKGAFDRHEIHLAEGVPLPPIRLLGLGHIYQGQSITGELRGKVTTGDGLAQSHGAVRLLSQVSQMNPLAETSTDEDGRFILKYTYKHSHSIKLSWKFMIT